MPTLPVDRSLCASCACARRVESRRGSVFLLCRSPAVAAKYPPQPVLRCPAYAPARRQG